MSEMVTLTIDGNEVKVPAGSTILDAAKEAGVKIPTLCFLKDINEIGACRMCVVDVGARSLQASCVYPVSEGLKVITNSPEVREARRVTLELILSNHEKKCLSCVRSENCELQKLAKDLNVNDTHFEGITNHYEVDDLSTSIVRDPNKCILCRRCVSVCKNVQTVSAIETNERGFNTIVSSPFEMALKDTPCVNCGQCIVACPVGALREKDNTEIVWDAIANPDLHVVVQTAPAVRVAIGEEFGLPIGTRCTGKMVSALKKLGFDKVFDTNFSADLTILEEGTELLSRVKNGGKLPMITSCSPGWIRFCELNYPEFLDNLSTCKSPQQMFGAIVKSYYAEKEGIDPKKIFSVSIMPCTSKKTEANRPEMEVDGLRDVDISLTTRELGDMIKQARIKFVSLPDEEPDSILGQYTGAGAIFGATGGVMEAALRTVADILTGKDLEEIEYQGVRGLDGVKESSVVLPIDGKDTEVKIAVAHGTANAAKVLEAVKKGEKEYHFIEVMACPGGCVHGGGQSHVSAKERLDVNPKAKRADALYELDKSLPLRKSHKNPEVIKLYEEYLKEPNSHISHKLLHTHYYKRDAYEVAQQEEYNKMMEKLK
jgi:iron-only hydrogenase group A